MKRPGRPMFRVVLLLLAWATAGAIVNVAVAAPAGVMFQNSAAGRILTVHARRKFSDSRSIAEVVEESTSSFVGANRHRLASDVFRNWLR